MTRQSAGTAHNRQSIKNQDTDAKRPSIQLGLFASAFLVVIPAGNLLLRLHPRLISQLLRQLSRQLTPLYAAVLLPIREVHD